MDFVGFSEIQYIIRSLDKVDISVQNSYASLLLFLGLIFSALLKWSDYSVSIAITTARYVGLLYRARIFCRQRTSCTFQNLPILRALNTATICRLVLELFVWRFLTQSRKESAM